MPRARSSVNQRVASSNSVWGQNNPTAKSLSFRLKAQRHGLAENAQCRVKAALSKFPGLPVGLPKSPRRAFQGCASQSLRR
jgi:hypothetical protein